jgi:hypothetical protein
MKRILVAMMITLLAATAANASDVGVSVSIGQPGFYLNIGNFPPPVVYAHPVVGLSTYTCPPAMWSTGRGTVTITTIIMGMTGVTAIKRDTTASINNRAETILKTAY